MKYNVIMEIYTKKKIRLAVESNDETVLLKRNFDDYLDISLTPDEIDEIIEMLKLGKEYFLKRKESVVLSE